MKAETNLFLGGPHCSENKLQWQQQTSSQGTLGGPCKKKTNYGMRITIEISALVAELFGYIRATYFICL